jgi:PleD family two-component response regulator
MHGGYLWVNSELGKGSTFTVLLPAQLAPETTTLELPIIIPDSRPLVLVLDDDPTGLQLVRDYLNDAQYQVVTTRNPAELMVIAKHIRPSIIITDVMMPNISGWEILRQLKSDIETMAIPVIVMSIVEQRNIGLQLGAADYLVKPVPQPIFLRTLERLVVRNG